MEPWPLFPDPTAPALPRPMSRNVVRPSPDEALARLRAGNFRFALGTSRPRGDAALSPYAIVVSCIDARVPVEAVFEQRVGAICVVRSAGHVLDQAVVGSIEFAVTELHVSLVVVLGHDDCRAIGAAIETVHTGRAAGGARRYLVDKITPAVLEVGPVGCSLDQVTRAHIRRTVAALKQTDYLNQAVKTHRIDVVGAIYRLDNGHVEML